MTLHIAQSCLERKRLPRQQADKAPETPAEFNPAHFPIISRHWFGIDPTSSNRGTAALVADPWFHHQVELLCARGPRLPVELLAELAIEHGLEDVVRKKLRRYLDIPDDALDLTGGRRLPLPPIHAVQGGKP